MDYIKRLEEIEARLEYRADHTSMIKNEDVRFLIKTIREWEDGSRIEFEKLDRGTLHVGYCNGNHEKEVGAPNMICNCYLGQKIRSWRHRNKQLAVKLERLKDHVCLEDAQDIQRVLDEFAGEPKVTHHLDLMQPSSPSSSESSSS